MKTAPLTTSESLLLDVIRTVAAILVALGHLTQPFFSTGWPDLLFLARGSVGIFFVLSGFVIRYVTCRKRVTLGHYLGDRASRIYSIAIPALILTLVADSISKHVNPAFYSNWAFEATHPLLRVVVNLLFLGQVWKWIFNPLSNSPFWSLNFEVAYYLLYGCWFYLAGRKRWLLIAGIALVNGPLVLFLAPLWIAGCVLHDAYQHWNAAAAGSRTRQWIAAGGGAVLLFALAASRTLVWLDRTGRARSLLAAISRPGVKPQEYLFGLVWSVLFFGLLLLARRFTIRSGTRLIQAIRFISEGTFPIYLTHFPLYVLIAAVIPYHHASAAAKLTIFAGVIVFGILAGHPGNILKRRMRALSMPFAKG